MERNDYERSGTDEDAELSYVFFLSDGPLELTEQELVNDYMRLREQLEAAQSIDRSEWREGMVSVYDHEGNCVGSMGQETWTWMLDGGKEQLEAAERECAHLRERIDSRSVTEAATQARAGAAIILNESLLEEFGTLRLAAEAVFRSGYDSGTGGRYVNARDMDALGAVLYPAGELRR